MCNISLLHHKISFNKNIGNEHGILISVTRGNDTLRPVMALREITNSKIVYNDDRLKKSIQNTVTSDRHNNQRSLQNTRVMLYLVIAVAPVHISFFFFITS